MPYVAQRIPKTAVNLPAEFGKKYNESVCLLNRRDEPGVSDVRLIHNAFGLPAAVKDEVRLKTGTVNLSKLKLFNGKQKWYSQSVPVSEYYWRENVYPFPLGLVNVDRHVMYIERIPQVQWKRGAARQNTRFKFPARLLLEDFEEVPQGFINDPKLVHAVCVKPHPTTGTQAIEEVLNKKALSRAISPEFWVSVSGKHPYLVVGYKQYFVGKVQTKNTSTPTVVLMKDCEALLESLSQYIGVSMG